MANPTRWGTNSGAAAKPPQAKRLAGHKSGRPEAAQYENWWKKTVSKYLERVALQFAPMELETPAMAVRVLAGSLAYGSSELEIAEQQTGTITAPSANPRYDRVVMDEATGVISVVTGAEAASPTKPSVPTGKRKICAIYLTPGMPFIKDDDIEDERTLLPGWKTQSPGDNSRAIATTAYLDSKLDQPNGIAVLDNTSQIAQSRLRKINAWSWIGGLTLSASGTTLTVQKGGCMDSTNVQFLVNGGTFTKILHASGTWAAGSGANGGAAASAANTWYYVFALGKSSDPSAFDIGMAAFNTDPATTQANMLANSAVQAAGFDRARRIGCIKTDGSKNITSFVQREDEFYWNIDMGVSINAASNSTTGTLRTFSYLTGGDIPPGLRVRAICIGDFLTLTGGGTSIFVWDPALGSTRTDRFRMAVGSTGNTSYGIPEFFVRANASQQVYDACDSAYLSGVSIRVKGWIDNRGDSL